MKYIKSCVDCKPADIDCQISAQCKKERRYKMEKVATCNCGCQSWQIMEFKIKCSKCGKEYKFYEDDPAHILINLVNDNF